MKMSKRDRGLLRLGIDIAIQDAKPGDVINIALPLEQDDDKCAGCTKCEPKDTRKQFKQENCRDILQYLAYKFGFEQDALDEANGEELCDCGNCQKRRNEFKI